jgi:hypothetical protein
LHARRQRRRLPSTEPLRLRPRRLKRVLSATRCAQSTAS